MRNPGPWCRGRSARERGLPSPSNSSSALWMHPALGQGDGFNLNFKANSPTLHGFALRTRPIYFLYFNHQTLSVSKLAYLIPAFSKLHIQTLSFTTACLVSENVSFEIGKFSFVTVVFQSDNKSAPLVIHPTLAFCRSTGSTDKDL